MPSDGNSMLYTDDEPGYRTTKLDSGIPPPSLSTLPRIVKAPRGGGSGAVPIQGQPNRNARQLPPHSHQQPRRMNEFHESVAPAAPRPAADVVGRFFVVIDNIHGPNLIEQLSTPDWSRMMSERDDVRGRRTDHRLLGGEIGLVKDLERQKETLIKAALSTREFNQVCAPNNPYEALAQCSALGNLSAIVLGHLDFLLHPVREYLKPGAMLQFVDLGSRQGGFSRYILWRSNQHRNGGGAKGWYFGCGDSAAVKQSPAITGSGRGLDIEELSLSLGCSSIADSLTEFGLGLQTKPDILDPTTVEAFIEFVKGNSTNTVGVDLVVGECDAGNDLPDFGTDLERRQYAFILAQAVIALRVLRKGGTFVFKMADTTTPLSAEILFLLHSCFERMAIARSLTSRPTSAERYILCNHLRGDPRWIASHLLAALTRINTDQFKLSHLVSWTRVSAEKKFIDKIASVNVTLARTQMLGLKYAMEQRLSSSNNADYQPSKFQIDVAERCLKNWDLQTK
ncbi:hypothetical protein GGI19_004169 [Coemansia pectinata]|uniref:Cap-specific mRNA (nucleoside-2'-O-)-methyltransferase 1 n=1 Tax=Coemansia pectinata TaxID=1052879 RepID=A0A9W8GUD6_9FUNG|nr:hypothetical protein GGI19_004169 [Coemansia pectinata]